MRVSSYVGREMPDSTDDPRRVCRTFRKHTEARGSRSDRGKYFHPRYLSDARCIVARLSRGFLGLIDDEFLRRYMYVPSAGESSEDIFAPDTTRRYENSNISHENFDYGKIEDLIHVYEISRIIRRKVGIENSLWSGDNQVAGYTISSTGEGSEKLEKCDVYRSKAINS